MERNLQKEKVGRGCGEAAVPKLTVHCLDGRSRFQTNNLREQLTICANSCLKSEPLKTLVNDYDTAQQPPHPKKVGSLGEGG